MDLRAEFDLAQRALSTAFERARAVRYRSGSREMIELQLAEQSYRGARRRYLLQAVNGRAPEDDVLDLREAETSGARTAP